MQSSLDAPIRVLVVDDNVTYRKIVSDLLGRCPGVDVVGTAANGQIALQRILQHAPDLLILDLEMPEMNGLQLLAEIHRQKLTTAAIMLSALTAQGAKSTLDALNAGALDFVLKPSGNSLQENSSHLRNELQSKIAAFSRRRSMQRALHGQRAAPVAQQASSSVESGGLRKQPWAGPPHVVAIGISTGGPKALTEMLPQLPADFPVPVLIVQHMPPVFTKSLAEDLHGRCQLPVREAIDGHPVRGGEIWIAPGGKQMKIERKNNQVAIVLTDDPPEGSCRPSVDYLFRSVAEIFGGHSLGVIMTGMGSDGALGCRRLKHCGATILAQDESTCVVYGMPREVVEKGLADVVLPLCNIASEISRLVKRGASLCK